MVGAVGSGQWFHLMLTVSSQGTPDLASDAPEQILSPARPFHFTAIAWLWWFTPFKYLCLFPCSLKSFPGLGSGFLVTLISPHKSVPPFSSSFLQLFSELSPICLHISSTESLNRICWTKSHIWKALIDSSTALNTFQRALVWL